MRFIIDAQLPVSLSNWLTNMGYDAIHTSSLSKGNKTSEKEIIELAQKEKRVVLTKDNDFFELYLVKEIPEKLIFITTGNILNKELFKLIQTNLDQLLELIKENSVVELNSHQLIVHY